MTAALAGAPEAALARRVAAQDVRITWTTHGIPHIVAPDFRGLGYGFGYATAKLDPCGMADMFATFSGQRSLRFGEGGTDIVRMLGRSPIANPANDAVRRLLVDDAQIARARAAMSPEAKALVDGYAAGITHFVESTPTAVLPKECRTQGAPFAITSDDVIRRVAGMAMLLSSGLFLQDIYDAAPPDASIATIGRAKPPLPADRLFPGSNAYAFGRTMTGGAGLLFGNPHFFWDGPDRFVEAQLTIPGRFDVMGASLLGFPAINIGFNRSLAWSHTVSTDVRGAIYALKLDPADPTRYMVDGRSLPMERRRVSIRVRTESGAIASRSHVFWWTRYGPVVESASLSWTREQAYALRDANRDNFRLIDQWLAIGRSRDVGSLRAAIARLNGLPWVDTLAADHNGQAFYTDISVAPDLNAAALAQCRVTPAFALSAYIVPLDGSRSACDWRERRGAIQPGLIPPDDKPSLVRRDYVENSNNSPWLANPAHPLEGYSPLVGAERTPLNFRARQGHDQLALLKGRVTPGTIERLFGTERSLQADLIVDALVRACRATPTVVLSDGDAVSLDAACTVLARWDRRYDLDSRGAQLFAAFVKRAKLPGTEDLASNPALWRVPFDPAHPLSTPRDLNDANPEQTQALGKAVRDLMRAGIPLDARLGEVQFVTRNGQRIPLPGGATFSALSATLKPGVGFTAPLNPSNSYIQVVTFGRDGPIADAVLASSQSRDPASPFFADQTLLYSRKQWMRLPFSSDEVKAQAIEPVTILHMPERR